MSVLLWGHAALSGLALVTRPLPERIRGIVIHLVCAAGVGSGVALFLERHSGEAWRTTVVEPRSAALVGIAIATAWAVTAALTDEDDRWRAAVLVGVAAAGLALFASAQWSVPALLFWWVSSLAAGALAAWHARRTEVWIAIALSDLCLAAGIIGHIVDSDTWQLPTPAPDRSFWLLAAAAVLRVAAVPRVGVWRAIGTAAAPALPLLVGGGFVVAAGVAGRPEPWLAVGLCVAALAQAIWGVLARNLDARVFAGWPSAVALGLIYVTPEVAPLVGAAACLAVGALALWPLAAGQAQAERGLVVALTPPTAAFAALVFGAERGFDVSRALEGTLESIPWIVVTALVPLLMSAGAVLGARVGRERRGDGSRWWPAGATWLLVAGTIALGLVPGALEFPDDVVGSESSFLALLVVALVAGAIAAALWSLRHPDHRRAPRPEPAVIAVAPPTRRESLALRPPRASVVDRVLVLVAGVLALASTGAVAWATYEGLRQGFL